MTYAPPTLQALGTYWIARGGRNLGIVGDTAHAIKGVSYHLGKSQLIPGAYSARELRDRNGLTEAASAIDLGRIDGSLVGLQRFSDWLARQCVKNVPGTEDIREVIYSPNGRTVLGFKDGIDYLIPGYGDNTHLTHTHISYYRDSEKRDKRPVFRAYFDLPDTATETFMPGLTLTDIALEPGWVTVKDIQGVQAVQVDDPAQRFVLAPGSRKPTIGKARVVGDPFGPDTTESRHIVRLLAGKDDNGAEVELAVILASQVDGPEPAPVANCDVAVKAGVTAALDTLTAPVAALVTAIQEVRP